jgi:glutamyl-tRNA synthetase
MSKRTDAVSVMQYKEMGILPEALLNYLARLCFGHGDAEIFSLKQFIEWFDFKNVSSSPARFDMKKLLWVNSQHIKQSANSELGLIVKANLDARGIRSDDGIDLVQVIDLVKSRVDNLNSLTYECSYFYQRVNISKEDKDKHLTAEACNILDTFAVGVADVQWSIDAIKQYIKDFCATNGLKMPQIGMPLRLKLCGTTQTPSFDMILYLLGKDEVLKRIRG